MNSKRIIIVLFLFALIGIVCAPTSADAATIKYSEWKKALKSTAGTLENQQYIYMDIRLQQNMLQH